MAGRRLLLLVLGLCGVLGTMEEPNNVNETYVKSEPKAPQVNFGRFQRSLGKDTEYDDSPIETENDEPADQEVQPVEKESEEKVEDELLIVGDVLQYTAQQIDGRNYVVAATKYLKLKDIQTPLPDLVKIAYKEENIEKILKFSDHLPWLLLRGIVAEHIVKEMKTQNHMENPMITVVYDYAADLWNKQNDAKVKAESKHIFTYISQELKFPILALIDKWGKKIKAGDYQDIVDFTKDNQRPFGKRVRAIVQAAYGPNDETQMNILTFANQLDPDLTVITHIELYNQMVALDHITLNPLLRLVHSSEKLFNRGLAFSVKQELSLFWENIPENLRALVSSEGFCLKKIGPSKYYFLYVKERKDELDDTVMVTTRRRESGLSKMWKLEPTAVLDNYRIKSVGTEHYLYAAPDHTAYDKDRRKVFTRVNDSSLVASEWEIQDSDWKENHFYFFNMFYKEYLDVYEEGNVIPLDKGFVHTWRNGIAGKYPAWSVSKVC